MLHHISFNECMLNSAILRCMEVETCDFRFAAWQNARLDKVKFDANSLQKIRFDKTVLQNMEMPKGSLKIALIQNCTLENVTFTGVRFIKCNFKGVTCRGRCVFERCNVDAETWLTNPELFDGNGVKRSIQAKTAKN